MTDDLRPLPGDVQPTLDFPTLDDAPTPTFFRADSALRKAVDRGESTVDLARTDPASAQLESLRNQRARVLTLSATPDLMRTYLRAVTDRPIEPDDALKWAKGTNNVDLDTWARRNSIDPPGGFMAGISAELPHFLGAAENEDEKLKGLITGGMLGLAVLGMVRGKSPRSLLKTEQTAQRILKQAQSSFDRAYTFAKRAPENKAAITGLRNASEKLATAKDRVVKEVVPDAKISEMAGKPDIPREFIERMDDRAQQDHMIAAVQRANSPEHAVHILGKYRPILRRNSGGPLFMRTFLDELGARVGNMNLSPERVGRMIEMVDGARTKQLSAESMKIRDEWRAELRKGFGDLGEAGEEFNTIIESEDGRAALMQYLEDAGGLIPRSEEGTGMTFFQFFKSERETAIFDRDLQWLVNLNDIQGTKETKGIYDFGRRSNEILKGMSEGELVAFGYYSRGRPVPTKPVPFGDLVPEFKVLKKTAGGFEAAPAGWNVIGGKGIKVAINNPNKLVAPIASPIARGAAERWRTEIMDPLASLGGLPKDQFLEWYLARIYHKDTIRSMAKQGLLNTKAAKRILDADDIIMDPSTLTPGSEMVWQSLLSRELPDLELYIMDPRVIAPVYIRGAMRKVAFDPVLREWDRIKAAKFTPEAGASAKTVKGMKTITKHYDALVQATVGRQVTKQDNMLVKWLDQIDSRARGQSMIDNKFVSSGWTRWMGLHTFGSFLREPGARPATRIANFIKGLEYQRKIGYSLSTPVINSFQAIQNSISQSSNPVYALHDFAVSTPGMRLTYSRTDELWNSYMATGLMADTTKFIGERGTYEKVFDGLQNPSSAFYKVSEPFWRGMEGALGKPRETIRENLGPGKMFQITERTQAFRSYARAILDAERGRVYREGVGIQRGAPVTDPTVKNLIGFLAARREQFGGRASRAPIFRDPLGGVISQFLMYSYRQTGMIGKQFRYTHRAGKRAAAKWKAGDKLGARQEYYDNVFAPAKTLVAMAAIAYGFKIAGVDFGRGAAQVFGFFPYVDTRSLGQGTVSIADELGGPFVSDVRRGVTELQRMIKSHITKEERMKRTTQFALHFLKVGEVQAKRTARALLDEDMSTEDKVWAITGYPAEREAALERPPKRGRSGRKGRSGRSGR